MVGHIPRQDTSKGGKMLDMPMQPKALNSLFRTLDQTAKALNFRDYDELAEQMRKWMQEWGEPTTSIAAQIGINMFTGSRPSGTKREARQIQQGIALFNLYPTKAAMAEAIQKSGVHIPPNLVQDACRNMRRGMKTALDRTKEPLERASAKIGLTLAGSEPKYRADAKTLEEKIQKEMRKQKKRGEPQRRREAINQLAAREGTSPATIYNRLKDAPTMQPQEYVGKQPPARGDAPKARE
jgi:hypothetical protein